MFLNRLRENAYKDLDITNHTIDLQGWMDSNFGLVFDAHVSNKSPGDPLTVIEVGTWKGLSAYTMAHILKMKGFTNFKIICVDTWLGAPEFWTWGLDDPTRGDSLKMINGYPSVFSTFTKNMKTLGFEDVVVPLPLSSIQAVDVLKYHNITADVIYIDAAHEYEPVKQDINAYCTLLNKGGMLFGDDYCDSWLGVVKAVDEVLPSKQLHGAVWSSFF